MYIAAFVEYVAFLDVMRTVLGLTNACTAFALVS